MPTAAKQIFSTLEADGTLTVELADTELPDPTGNQVLVKMEASPINPSDLMLLFGLVDLDNAVYTPGKVVAQLAEPYLSASKVRFGKRLPVGNEGAGTVIAAGDSECAKSLIGARVCCVPGSAYSTHALADAQMCLKLPDDANIEDGAAAFVNPMTALGFIETARAAKKDSIIHAAAASNLGRMLNRICQEDGIQLVNIVRTKQQADLLVSEGAKYVLNSSDSDFYEQLVAAVGETNAFMGFDPIGGGLTSDTCFKAMEQVAVSRMSEYSRYGSPEHKTMYIYGALDLSPTILSRTYGFEWTLTTWFLTTSLFHKATPETIGRLRDRVANNLSTTFKSEYKARVSLEGMLTKEAVVVYRQMKSGEKYIVRM